MKYRDLDSWRTAIDLVAEIYRVTGAWPSREQFGLTSQIRRAAVSIPSNIGEGYGRGRRREYVHALRIARGSLAELETQLVVAARIGYGDRESLKEAWSLSQRVGAMLTAQISALARSKKAEPDSLISKTRIPNPESRIPTSDSRSGVSQ